MQKDNLKKITASGKIKHKKMALGKGLGALIPGIAKEEEAKQDYFYCDIDLIRPNRFQPRVAFSEDDLQELGTQRRAQPGDVFLLCSDGLNSMVGDDRIAEILEQNKHDVAAACRALIDAANDCGGEDNITVIVLALDESS